MKSITDLINPGTNPLPEEVQDLVSALLEGRVHSLAIIAEVTDADGEKAWIKNFELDMDENESDDFAFVGAASLLLKELQDELSDPGVDIAMLDDGDGDD